MFSYWEQQSFFRYDHIIIGAGITGISTAIELKEREPKATVMILERGILPTGASTKNAGFACMGSVTELLADLKLMPEDEVVTLFTKRKQGLEILRKRLGDERIGYKANGSYELISESELPALDKIDYLNQLLQPVNKQDSFKLANDKIRQFGFAENYTKALIENTCEGELNTGMMMKALIDYAIMKGVEIKTGVAITRYEEQESAVVVSVDNPLLKTEMQFKCRSLFICTIAFTKTLLPGVDVTPGRGQVVVTKPVEGLKFKGVYHFDEGYYYFREIDGRVLLGGARNADFEGEETTTFANTEIIQQKLEEKLCEIILPHTNFEIEYRWSGIMAFGPTKQPIVKQFSPRVYGAFRMGGMGVALGSLVGRQLAQLINNSVDG